MNFGSALQLMLPSFCLCVLMVAMLSYLGIHVIKREIIFVDLALAQIAALGALIALLLGIPLHTQASYWFSVAVTAIAAVVFTLSRTRESRVPQEAVIGLVYAIAAALAIILIDKAPHGAEHIKDILTGSILWVKWQTVATVAAVYGAVGLFHFLCRRPFLMISANASQAQASGVNVRLWDFLFYLSFGLVITVSVGSAGVLLVFVFLVAPAVMAVLITDRLLYQLLFGWALGIAATISGLIVSYLADLSSGPLVIGAYAVALVLVSAVIHILRAPDRARALRNTCLTALSFALAAALLFLGGRALGVHFGHQGHAHAHSHGLAPHDESDAHASGSHLEEEEAEAQMEAGLAGESLAEMLAGASNADGLRTLFAHHPGPADRVAIVTRALDLDPGHGAALALRFLATDPPLFFAQTAVDALDAILSHPSGLDVSEPFGHPANQQAAAGVRAEFGLTPEPPG